MNISYGVGDMLDINMIKELWVRKFEDVASEIAVWDSVASEYLLEEKNNFKEDPFLQFMEEKIQLSQNMEVLDVGCGAGAYSCRIAERAGNVTGVGFLSSYDRRRTTLCRKKPYKKCAVSGTKLAYL